MEQPTVHTCASLLHGIQLGDPDQWEEFHHIYTSVIRGFALKAGLTETEADEAVQETFIGVARNVGEFHYDPQKCRFKTWLLNLAAWRVKNQFTKRQRWDARVHGTANCGAARTGQSQELAGDDGTRTSTIERLPDRNAKNLNTLWEEQWHTDLLKTAIAKMRLQFSPTQFQIFDLNVVKEWPAGDVARSLGVSLPSVYLAKHRISSAIKKEITRLERKMDAGL